MTVGAFGMNDSFALPKRTFAALKVAPESRRSFEAPQICRMGGLRTFAANANRLFRNLGNRHP